MSDVTSIVIAFIALVIAIVAIIVASTHRGAQGPPGPQGPAGESTIPPGTIALWANPEGIPSGWYELNGGLIDISVNPILTNLGPPLIVATLTTQARLADWTGRFVVGSNGGTLSPGQVGGSSTVTLALNNIPPHTHSYDHFVDEQLGGAGVNGWRNVQTNQTGSTGGNSSGTTDPFSIMPPYLVAKWIVKGG